MVGQTAQLLFRPVIQQFIDEQVKSGRFANAEEVLEELNRLWGRDQQAYFAATRRSLDQAESLMRAEDPALYRQTFGETLSPFFCAGTLTPKG